MKSVLIVEDDFQLAGSWQFPLEAEGIRVVHEIDAEGAIACLKSDPSIELVITDMMLAPGKNSEGEQDGLLVLAYVSLNMATPPKLLAISGALSAPGVADAFSLLSPKNVLRKPVDAQDLVSKVKELLDERSREVVEKQRITEAERALRLNQFAVEHASDAVFWIRKDGSFSDVNQKAADNLGYTQDELCQMRVADINPEINLDTWPQHWQETKDAGVFQFESIHHRRDGTSYPCVVTKHFLNFEKQEIIYATVRDISVQKQAEEALLKSKRLVEESERRFRSLADSASPLVWTTELDSTCSWLNKRWLDFCGRPLSEQTGYGWLETVHPDDREKSKQAYLAAFENQEPFVLAYRLRRYDGEYRWHTVNATPRFDENDVFVGYVGMSFDDQDAKESLQALEASELALKRTSETLKSTLGLLGTSDGVWDWQLGTGKATYAPGFRKLLGFDPDDRVGLPDTVEAFQSRIHPDDQQGHQKAFEESIERQIPFEFDFRVQHKEGRYIWVRSRANASFDPQGQPLRMVGSSYDISAQKDVELERDRFFNTAAELYAAVDLKTMKWLKLSPTWSVNFGYDLNTMLENDVPSMHPVEEHEAIRKQVENLLRGELVRGWICKTLHQDGSIRFVEWNIDPPLPDESVVYGTGRDVTDLRKYLNQIEANASVLKLINEQLERSNEDLSQFAYVASHDLQEPLRAISGFLQLLKSRYNNKLDEQALGYIEKSVDGAARMNQLINDLLHYSRVTNESTEPQPISLTQCVATACEKIDGAIQSSNADIQLNPLPTIQGMAPLLVQLFQNLIGNAIKYRSEAAPIIHISAQTTETEHLIFVKDNGIGIPEKYQTQVFALFKRLHHRNEYSGTGIGLAICQRAIERHGGTISVRPNDDQGSCFTLTFPRNG